MQNASSEASQAIETAAAQTFIARWQGVTASEQSTAQSSVRELCDLLGLASPHPTPAQDYMFERPVTFSHGDGSTTPGRVDCYRRGHFVLEAKKLRAAGHTQGFDDAMLRARAQAEGCARALPALERRPPFLLVVDVGNVIAQYSEFSRLATEVLRFNGKLFQHSSQDGYSLLLNPEQIDGLILAANSNWREVEPAIFGTLLERALDPAERHALGAHYTPRAYVERLALPTVIEPLRADGLMAQAAALVLAQEAAELSGKAAEQKLAEARQEVRKFHHQLCSTRVLDPACGSGNFRYVTLEHLKRLEGEVVNQLADLGESQDRLGFEGETDTPRQLLGIELNERAAAMAELVLWIGYLQWHIRTRGNNAVAEPVVHDYGNIAHRDAVLAWQASEPGLWRRRPAAQPLGRQDLQAAPGHRCAGARRGRAGAAVALQPAGAGRVAAVRCHRRQPALHWRQHGARSAGRRLAGLRAGPSDQFSGLCRSSRAAGCCSAGRQLRRGAGQEPSLRGRQQARGLPGHRLVSVPQRLAAERFASRCHDHGPWTGRR